MKMVTFSLSILIQNSKFILYAEGFMKDASGQISNTLSYDLKETEQGYQVTLHLDKDWLNDAVRVYPVRLILRLGFSRF